MMAQALNDPDAERRAEMHRAKRRVPNRLRRIAPKDTWIEAYLSALVHGHTKFSAAALAGVHPRTPYSRAERDQEFADLEYIAYHQGTAILEKIAMDRITDPEKPSDSILKHLLACRGLNPKQIVEMTGADGGPIEINTSVDLSKLPLWLQKEMIRCMEAIERGEEPPDRPMLEEYEKVIEIESDTETSNALQLTDGDSE